VSPALDAGSSLRGVSYRLRFQVYARNDRNLKHTVQSMSNTYYVYILSNKKNGTLYVGVTSNLEKRVYEHKHNLVDGLTSKYSVHELVYFEETENVQIALTREKTLKKWKRSWKIALIEKMNPYWKDLSQNF